MLINPGTWRNQLQWNNNNFYNLYVYQYFISLIKSGLQDRSGQMKNLKEAKLEFKKYYQVGVLKMSGGHVSNAVKSSGRNRTE